MQSLTEKISEQQITIRRLVADLESAKASRAREAQESQRQLGDLQRQVYTLHQEAGESRGHKAYTTPTPSAAKSYSDGLEVQQLRKELVALQEANQGLEAEKRKLQLEVTEGEARANSLRALEASRQELQAQYDQLKAENVELLQTTAHLVAENKLHLEVEGKLEAEVLDLEGQLADRLELQDNQLQSELRLVDSKASIAVSQHQSVVAKARVKALGMLRTWLVHRQRLGVKGCLEEWRAGAVMHYALPHLEGIDSVAELQAKTVQLVEEKRELELRLADLVVQIKPLQDII